MPESKNIIQLSHGNGGRMMHDLIEHVFVSRFSNEILSERTDSAIVAVEDDTIAFTTDSFVVDPIYFPGGDIGKLAGAGLSMTWLSRVQLRFT